MGRSADRLSGILVATSPGPSDRNFVAAYRENLMATGMLDDDSGPE